MGRSNLRSIRRLKADAAPVFVELDRRVSEWKKSLPSLAEDHMLRVVAVFRYGGPRIDEALAHARGRACSKLEIYNCNDSSLSNRMRTILQGEPPNKSIRSKIFACVPKMPDWLRYLCAAHISMRMLGFKLRPLSPDMFRLHPAQADIRAWPSLPKGMLEAHSVPG